MIEVMSEGQPPSVDEIFKALAPAPWRSSGRVRVTLIETLPTLRDQTAVELVNELMVILDAKEEELGAVRDVLSASLALGHDQHNEIIRLRKRLVFLLEDRRPRADITKPTGVSPRVRQWSTTPVDESDHSKPNSIAYPPPVSHTEMTAMRASRFVSEYLKSETLKHGPRTLTIEGTESLSLENKDTGRVEEKLALLVDYGQKLVLNKENTKTLIDLFETEETEDWTGKQFEAYYDPEIKFGGKKVGGIRVRAAVQVPF